MPLKDALCNDCQHTGEYYLLTTETTTNCDQCGSANTTILPSMGRYGGWLKEAEIEMKQWFKGEFQEKVKAKNKQRGV